MSLWNNKFTFTGRKAPFFGWVYKDVTYLDDPNKIHLTKNSPEVISNWGFFIKQKEWTPHFFQWKKWSKETVMVKLNWIWYYFLFREYIWKTKWIVTLKCKEIFERAHDDEVINFLVKDEWIKTIDPKIAKNILWNLKNTTSDRVNETLSASKSLFTIEQPGWVTHYVWWKMVKLKNGLLELLQECLAKTKWKISLKCKQVFERWNLWEIKKFIKITKENKMSSDYDLVHN